MKGILLASYLLFVLSLSCGGSFDAELRHLRLQRRPLHAELGGGAGRTADEPVGLLQRMADVLALGVFERGQVSRVAISGDASRLQLG